jgi:ankyrin repeat protein
MISCLTGKHIGSHIDCVDKHGETALHYAARYGHVGVLSLLLASRADTRAIGTQGDARSSDTAHKPRSLAYTAPWPTCGWCARWRGRAATWRQRM